MYSDTRTWLDQFDNEHDFERMCTDILLAQGYENVVPIAPRGGSDNGKDITFVRNGRSGLACVTLRKDIEKKFYQDFAKRKVGDFEEYILYSTAYITSQQKEKFEQYCSEKLNAKFLPQDIEALTSLLDNSKLSNIKEKWMNASQQLDVDQDRDKKTYLALANEWVKYANIDDWQYWTYQVLVPRQPLLSIELTNKLDALAFWLFRRVWPIRYPEVKIAFENFLLVLRDFLKAFHERAEINEYGTNLYLPKVELAQWDTKQYEEFSEQREFHMILVQDLLLELTRAANFVCDTVRLFIDPNFRLHQGSVVVDIGPTDDNPFVLTQLIRPQYTEKERTSLPYPYLGFEHFKKDRENRDICFSRSQI